MAARILANLLVAGGGVLIRAAAQAYRQAVINGTKAGVQAEGKIRSVSQMTLDEAQKILDVNPSATLAEIQKKYQHLFDVNETRGSFYLQSKVFRARERLKQDFEEKGIPWEEPEQPPPSEEKQQRL